MDKIFQETHRALVDHLDLNSLVGQLLQYIEATFTDKEQREAHKNITKSICRSWLRDIYKYQEGTKITAKNGNLDYQYEITKQDSI